MRHFIGPHRAATENEFAELALGTPVDLWLGVEGESEDERAARLAAARDILADDPALLDRLAGLATDALASQYGSLLRLVTVTEPGPTGRRRPAPARWAA